MPFLLDDVDPRLPCPFLGDLVGGGRAARRPWPTWPECAFVCLAPASGRRSIKRLDLLCHFLLLALLASFRTWTCRGLVDMFYDMTRCVDNNVLLMVLSGCQPAGAEAEVD